MKRRDFLRFSPLLPIASGVTSLLGAKDLSDNAGWYPVKGRTLIVLHLEGGCDGLNLVVPYRDDGYYRRRPGIAVPASSVLPLNDEVGFHPAFRELHQLYHEGGLAVWQGVAWPDEPMTHFRSARLWEQVWARFGGSHLRGSISTGAELREALEQTARQLACGSNGGIWRVVLKGFDTHVAQVDRGDPTRGRHAVLLRAISQSVSSFWECLPRAVSCRDEVALVVTTDFGRSVDQNEWLGTEHGCEFPMFMVGSGFSPGLHGTASNLDPSSGKAPEERKSIHPFRVLGEIS